MGPLAEKLENYLARKNAIYSKMLRKDQMEDMLNEQRVILKKIADTEDECDRLDSKASIKGNH